MICVIRLTELRKNMNNFGQTPHHLGDLSREYRMILK